MSRCQRQSGRSSGVEHDLAKVGVEGSNPFARSSVYVDYCNHIFADTPVACFGAGERRPRVPSGLTGQNTSAAIALIAGDLTYVFISNISEITETTDDS
jgi:hypothetical protein